MPVDVAHNGRDLEYVGADVKVRFRDADGVVRTYTKAQLDADAAKETEILTAMGISGTTITQQTTAYDVDESSNVLDEDGNILANTWATGKKRRVTTKDVNTNLFNDLGATA